LIDAHPDNSLSVITYGEKFARSKIQIGGGFSNFRPLTFYNDTIYPKTNKELQGFSIIQYQKEPFIFKGKELSFYEYVRNVLADGAVIYQPIIEFTDSLSEICQDVLYRRDAVEVAIDKHLDDFPHPERLPKNIYGADGEWEMYATPARDARLKASFRELKLYTKKVLNSFYFRERNIDYEGSDLKTDLRNIYLDKMGSCKFEMTNGSDPCNACSPDSSSTDCTEGIHIPTAFTPNASGNPDNDVYQIIAGKDIARIDFKIFDRWGNLVFQSDKKDFKWDGSYKSKPCNSGVYAYIVEVTYIDGLDKTFSGNITLLR
jgi:gliding motility-associated-like protein